MIILTILLVPIGILVLLVLWSVLFGSDRHGGATLGMKSAQEMAQIQAEAEADDMSQMVAIHNRDRVAKGQNAVSVDQLELEVMSEINKQREEQQPMLDKVELDELVLMTNSDRRKQGLPELSREEIARDFGGE